MFQPPAIQFPLQFGPEGDIKIPMFPVLILFALATLVVLIIGLVLMARGGAANKKYGNKLMVARVVLQGAAVLLLGLMFMVK